MNWFKKAQNKNSIRILGFSPGGYIDILSGSGKEYRYYNPSLDLIKKLKMLISQNRFGESWQLLRSLEKK
jgi:hypothetical protein